MFIGHFALAFGAKKLVPGVSLGTSFAAVQLADLAWPTFVLLGLERFEIHPGDTAFTPLEFVHYPYSHSLVALLGWALAFAALYMLVRRAPLRTGVVLAALVLSHWLLDFLSHRPDMPLTLHGAERFGLGLWDSVPATLVVESLLFAGGVFVYRSATRAIDRVGKVAFWALVGFLAVVYLANAFGPPPPSTAAVAWSAQAIWLLVLWAYWVDRRRAPSGR
jgi:hypothetical protein